jgi:hypothetical protein
VEQSLSPEADSYSDNKEVILGIEHGNCSLFTTDTVPDTEPVESSPHTHILLFNIYLNIILHRKYSRTPIILIN